MWHQDREFESESESKKRNSGSQNLNEKNGLNVEHFRYHITINYDKSSSACID